MPRASLVVAKKATEGKSSDEEPETARNVSPITNSGTVPRCWSYQCWLTNLRSLKAYSPKMSAG